MKAERAELPTSIQTVTEGNNVKVWLRENITQITKEDGSIVWRYDEYTTDLRDRLNLEQYLIANFDLLIQKEKQVETEKLIKEFTEYLDHYIDSVAQSKGYDNRITASLRAAAPESPWHAEGVAFVSWMDICYATAFQILEKVQNGVREIPKKDELIEELPKMMWT